MKTSTQRVLWRSQIAPASIGRAATLALHDELSLTPKPGLVTLIDCGSHDDMDAHTFMRSLFSLRHYFVQIAEAGFRHEAFCFLEACGIAAEQRMLAATGGVNTHRGAIFTLGLLSAAAGAALQQAPDALTPARLRDTLRRQWGTALTLRSPRTSKLPGGIAARRHALRSASEEAALGFPVLFDTALPALIGALGRGLTQQQARLDALFHTMAVLDDSNLAHRGGLEGLRLAQQMAREFLARGGIARARGLQEANAIAEAFVVRRLSPGGSADTLAAACLVMRVCDGL